MDPRFRALYNEQFTDAVYQRHQQDLATRLQCTFEFRLAETPVFLSDDWKARAVRAAHEIVAQLSDKERLKKMKRAIPARWDTPGMDALPNFTQVDFAVVRENGTLVPKLIELQGFPSLTALQVAKRDSWNGILNSMRGLKANWSCWFS